MVGGEIALWAFGRSTLCRTFRAAMYWKLAGMLDEWRRRGVGWKVWLGIFSIVIVIGVMNEKWQTIDKYFPALNRYLHSGKPTTQSDLEYLVAHFGSDADALNKLCLPDNPPAFDKIEEVVAYVKDCRAQTLAAKPILR